MSSNNTASKTKSKPIASISLDLDNKWSYMKTHGDAGWESYPSYFDIVVPRILDFLAERNLKITFFIVGQDVALAKNRDALQAIADAGHEIANHSFHHDPWLQRMSREEVQAELTETDTLLRELSGVKPIGFRGPGFSCSPTTLEVLADLGYEYDASSFPTYLGPAARCYYFLTARFSKEQKEERGQLYGSMTDGFKAIKPHLLEVGTAKQNILEIPVTTMPLLRLPTHLSYVLFLRQYSRVAARTYVNTGIRLCRLFGVAPSLLLHPLEFLSADDAPELKFFPAMQLSLDQKLEMVSEMIAKLDRHYNLGTMQAHAAAAREQLAARKSQPASVAPAIDDFDDEAEVLIEHN